MLTEIECPTKIYGRVLLVVASLRRDVEEELARIGAQAEWRRSIGGIESSSDVGAPTADVAVWSAILPDDGAVSHLQAWIESRQHQLCAD